MRFSASATPRTSRRAPSCTATALGPGFRRPGQWQETYPHATCEPSPYELGLTGDPKSNWGDFHIAQDGTVTRFILADPATQAAAEPELEAGS
jgi:hypothetical protein